MTAFTKSSEKRVGSSDTYAPVDDRSIEQQVLVRVFGSKDNPSYVYRAIGDPEAVEFLKTKKIQEEKEFEKAKRNRFLGMNWLNEEEKYEFFRLAELWIENRDILESLDPEFKQNILDSGILNEYKDIIDQYNTENQTRMEIQGEVDNADA